MDQFPWPPADVYAAAARIIDRARDRQIRIATAESCTGGLIAAALSEVPGASDVLDRAFVTYSNAAKVGLVNVDFDVIARHGAVSAEVACAMAEGALRASAASLAVAVTGIAGPTGGTTEKPVGLVYLATARFRAPPRSRKCLFGDKGRTRVRLAALEVALEMLEEALQEPPL